MKLEAAIIQYVQYRRSLGEEFKDGEQRLKFFVRTMGHNKTLADVEAKQVNKFLAGKGPITANWHCKHKALRGFYCYVLSRGYTKVSPLPKMIPKRPQPLIPYIYSVSELKVLLDASLTYQKIRMQLESYMVHTILLLLYGTGLRIGEAIRLKIADIDLQQALLTIRETKFYKTRLVPLGLQLTQFLLQYSLRRQHEGYSQDPQAPFFTGRNGKAVNAGTFQCAFKLIRKKAGVKRSDHHRYQPRIHDLRHTFAVHRLTQWYKQGADVQKWLPALSVYLGHVNLAATSAYLTMTPVLLEEAGRRFQTYAFKEESHD